MPAHLFYDIVFIAATGLAIGSALAVVLSGNPFYSSLALILNLVSLATFYLLLQADFLAAAQVIVYAGAVMIMFMFVTAYLGGRADEPTGSRPLWQTAGAFIVVAALVIEVIFAVGKEGFAQGASVSDSFGSPTNIGTASARPLPAGLRGHLHHADGGRGRRRGARLAQGLAPRAR